jgi:uncharacterized protein
VDHHVVLGLVLVVGVVMIAFGWPGIWLIVASAVSYNWLSHTATLGVATIVGVVVMGVVAEILGPWLETRSARKAGGSRRAEWGAILGGLAGAILGLEVPVEGSLLGALIGVFLGALVAEVLGGSGPRAAVRVASGAVAGRIVAAVAKLAIGCAMAVWVFAAAW